MSKSVTAHFCLPPGFLSSARTILIAACKACRDCKIFWPLLVPQALLFFRNTMDKKYRKFTKTRNTKDGGGNKGGR